MSQSQPRTKQIVLTGYIGTGKTTLFNKITNSNQATRAGGTSVTQEVFSRGSAYGNGFRVLDTPGFGVNSKKVEHACAVRCALTAGPINQILIVVKTERTDTIKNCLKKMLNWLYSKFRNVITIVLTHWDQVTDQQTTEEAEKIKQEIIKMIRELNVHSTLFCSKKQQGIEICQEIDKILLRGKAQQLILTDTEFYSNSDLIEFTDDTESQIYEVKEQLTIKFRKIYLVIQKFISNYDDKSVTMPEVMHALTIEIKNLANLEIEKFERENNEKFSKLYETLNDVNAAYIIDMDLKKELMSSVNGIIELAQRKMKVAQEHCFNFIKQCPFCSEIWIKVEGCDGTTTCGNFPVADSQIFKTQSIPNRFKFTISEKEVLVQDLGQRKALQSKAYSNPGKGIKGCGRQIVWSEVPPLAPYLIQELFDPGVLDYLANQVTKKELQTRLTYNIKNEVSKYIQEFKIKEV